MATAEAAAVSGLVRETKIITSVAHMFQEAPGGQWRFFDGKRLWITYGEELLAIDPESGEIVVAPISLPISLNELPQATAPLPVSPTHLFP
jgi:hypothetical protein